MRKICAKTCHDCIFYACWYEWYLKHFLGPQAHRISDTLFIYSSVCIQMVVESPFPLWTGRSFTLLFLLLFLRPATLCASWISHGTSTSAWREVPRNPFINTRYDVTHFMTHSFIHTRVFHSHPCSTLVPVVDWVRIGEVVSCSQWCWCSLLSSSCSFIIVTEFTDLLK